MLKPPFKWPGGKRRMLPQILPLLPESYGTYIEPFLGGGAVLLALLPPRALVGDFNPKLIEVFEALRDECEDVIQLVGSLTTKTAPGGECLSEEEFLSLATEASADLAVGEADYYRVRADMPTTRAGRAARFIYLNQHGFNGLNRENSKGEFNVPFGHRLNVALDVDNLRKVAKYLGSGQVKLTCQDWKVLTGLAQPGDLVFMDPPYFEGFTDYCAGGFEGRDLDVLYREVHRLHEQGIHVILTNSHCQEVLDRFQEFTLIPVGGSYRIGGGHGRKNKKMEVIISNLAPEPPPQGALDFFSLGKNHEEP